MKNHKSSTHITHESIPIIINDESSVLILGSLPSVKSREDGFYYAHPRNRFFKVLANVFNESEPLSIEDRKAFLGRHKIALYDVIYECDISGSSDASIKNAKVVDIKDILESHPNIKRIGVNGGKAKQLFDKCLLNIAKQFDIEVFYLPSTSPANARINLNELIKSFKLLFV